MSGLVIVDANLALKWVLAKHDSVSALALLNKWTNDGVRVIAPALFVYEVTNTFYQHARSGKLTYDEAKQALTDLFSVGVLLKFTFYKESVSRQWSMLVNLPCLLPTMLIISHWRKENIANTGLPIRDCGIV
ncbi:MAG: type II toxin-antitoxin system VapC family toxin [Ktedonobacteraceae bacterium]